MIFLINLQFQYSAVSKSPYYDYRDINYEYDGVNIQQDDDYTIPINNSFSKILDAIPIDKKFEQLNIAARHYSNLDIEVVQTQFKGLGMIANKNITKGETLFSYKSHKQMLSSKNINLKLFFLRTLDLQIVKMQQPRSNFTKKNENKTYNFLFNFLYHLCHYDQSFLQYDMVGLSTKYHSLFFMMTKYELELIDIDLYMHKSITQYRKSIDSQYQNMLYLMNISLSPEQMSLYYRRDLITRSEFYFAFHHSVSRCHDIYIGIQQHRVLLPAFHYLNQVDQQDDTNQLLTFQQSRKSFLIIIAEQLFKQNDEILIDYHMSQGDIYHYPLFFGFIPETIKQQCTIQLSLLSEQQSQYFKLPQYDCFDSIEAKKAVAYSMAAVVYKMNDEERNRFFYEDQFSTKLDDKIYQNNFYQYLVWAQKYRRIKLSGQNLIFWENALKQLNKRILELTDVMQTVSNYFEHRQKRYLDTYVAKLLYDFYTLYLQKLIIVKKEITNAKIMLDV